MLVSVIAFVNKLLALFENPKLRVRRVGLETGHETFGAVVDEKRYKRPHAPDILTYWVVEWEDAPGVWLTYQSHQFVWGRGHWNLIEK